MRQPLLCLVRPARHRSSGLHYKLPSVSKLANIRRFMLLPPINYLSFTRLHGLGLLCFCSRSACADGTAAALLASSGINGRLPDMAESTLPPDLSMAPHSHHFWRERAVERRVPFLCHRRVERCEVIEPRQRLAVRAVGAATAALRPVRYHSTVGVSLFAPPPDAPVGVWGDVLRRQTAVFLRVPLRRQLRKDRRKIVFTGNHFFPGANRTFCPVPYSGNGRSLPAVTFFTPPPYFPVGSRQYLLRGQRCVFFHVPF